MRITSIGVIAAALVAGCASHATLPSNGTTASPGIFAAGSGPDVGQPGSPAPHWSLVTPSSIFEPNHPVLGADGNIWFAGGTSSQDLELGSVTPQGIVKHFPVRPKAALISGTTVGPDGNIWFTLNKFPPPGPTYFAVGNITPDGVVTQYPLPTDPTLGLNGIATGPDGNLWITSDSTLGFDDEIYKVTTSGALTHYKIGVGKIPEDIVLGSDGALWFAELTGNAIGRITTSGKLSEFPLPAGLISPWFVVRAGDGNIWFTYVDQSTNIASIGKITPGGTITTYPNPERETEILGLAVGPDGALWFPEGMNERHHNPWQLRRITLEGVYDTVNRRIPLESPYFPILGIATGADGNLWVSEWRPSRFAVWDWRKMTVAPSSVTVGVGQTESIVTSETNYSGGWTAKSSNNVVATVTPGQQSGTFVVHGHASGSCTVTVSDTFGNFYSEPVTVQ